MIVETLLSCLQAAKSRSIKSSNMILIRFALIIHSDVDYFIEIFIQTFFLVAALFSSENKQIVM